MAGERTNISDLHQVIASSEIVRDYIPYAIIACGGSTIPCILLRKKWDDVDAYCLTGLTALLGLLGNFVFSIFFAYLTLAPAVFYTGLFVSMTKSNLCSPRALAVAGALSGILILYVLHIFSGIGGNLGLTATLSVLCVIVFFQRQTLCAFSGESQWFFLWSRGSLPVLMPLRIFIRPPHRAAAPGKPRSWIWKAVSKQRTDRAPPNPRSRQLSGS